MFLGVITWTGTPFMVEPAACRLQSRLCTVHTHIPHGGGAEVLTFSAGWWAMLH